jgi:signal transduction histidine kinase
MKSYEQLEKSVRRYSLLLKESKLNENKYKKIAELLIRQQENEKREISRELHDEIAQVLTGINFELAALTKIANEGKTDLCTRIEEAQNLIVNSVEIIHRFSRELRPMSLDHLGLEEAIRSYVKEFTLRTEFAISISFHSKMNNLDDIKKTVLFRVIQESLINVHKHAKASKVIINVKEVNNNIEMEIYDDGISFNVESMAFNVENRRLGLIGIKERVNIIDGKLSIRSSKGWGTLVRVIVPLTEKE